MLDFSKVNRYNPLFNLLQFYVLPVFKYVYHRRFRVDGKERLPKGEGFMVICNHQNGLIDALAIHAALHRNQPPVFLARADIFKKTFIAKLLRFLRIMPAYRKCDVGTEGLGNNQEIFHQASRILNEGDVVALFPEGGHQDHHYLGGFKKGFARMAFEACEASGFTKDLLIVPMGNHHNSYLGIQDDLLITIGEPYRLSDFFETYRNHPERALKELADVSRSKVNDLMLNVEDSEHYESINAICHMYSQRYKKQHGLKLRSLTDNLHTLKTIAKTLEEKAAAAPGEFNSLMERTEEYTGILKKLRLKDWIFSRTHAHLFVVRLLCWLILLPVFAACYVINAIPYHLTVHLTKGTEDPMLRSSFIFGIGALVTFPIWYLSIFAAVWIATKTFWIALAALLLEGPSLIIFHHCRIASLKLLNRVRKFIFKCRHDERYYKAAELRRGIIAEMDSMLPAEA